MYEVEKHRKLVNPGRHRGKRRWSIAEKLAFVRRMKRARNRKGNISRQSIRKSTKRYYSKYGREVVGSLAAKKYHKSAVQDRKRRKNVSSILTVYPNRNPTRRKRNRSKKIIIVNKGAKMAVRRKRRTRRATKRVYRRRRVRNVVYRRRIKRGMYAYSSNPGRRRRRYRRHNRAVVHHRRRYGRNPGFGVGGGVVTKVAGVVGGLAVTKLLCGFLPAQLNSGILGYFSTAVVAVAQGKLVGKISKSTALGNDFMIGGLAYLAAKILNDFFPSIGGYTGISGMGLIGGSSFYVPQVNQNGNMGAFVLPAAVSGAIPANVPTAGAGVGRLRRTGRLM